VDNQANTITPKQKKTIPLVYTIIGINHEENEINNCSKNMNYVTGNNVVC